MLSQRFSHLYAMAVHKNATVEEMITLEEDSVFWKEGRNRLFRVKKAYSLLVSPIAAVFPKSNIWVDRIPTKIAFFAWEAAWEKVSSSTHEWLDPSFQLNVPLVDVDKGLNELNNACSIHLQISEYLGLPVEGFEKEVDSLLRKLEARKDRRVVGLRAKRRPSSASWIGPWNGDGRWRGKGCFQFLPCVLDFHSGWLPWLSWNCGFGSEAAAKF
ncbi:hypothetical protein CK203_031616 [Vitis vinifera]|uniref:Reverse transcriptase zinc-binding domain-containing protein n=1 Tax=Vitis vinifera TaxID=29760 RepID=A0A438IFW1_VITVI|nr:hypothetical protein CK203_031616 [Vitis vinifera]